VDFFERVFFGVALSAVRFLSTTSAFFEVLFFFEAAVPESAAACEPEASAFFLDLLLAVVLESDLV
jgi:hypothetical protein